MSGSHARHLAILSGSFHGLRILSGVSYSIFLLKIGMTIQDLALLQMVFSLTILCIAYPSGILIHRYGSKLFFIMACLCIALYNGICILTPHILTHVIANVVYAFGLTLMANAAPTWRRAGALLENHPNDNYINYFGHLENECQAIWSLIEGFIGTLLPFLEPDAGNPHLRFDERDVETESWLGQ